MAGALGSLVVTLGLDAAQFTAGLSKSEFESKRWRDNTIKAAKEVGAIMGAGALAAAGGLALLTRSAIDAADTINKLTQKTGESAEVLSGLQYAFELGDVAGEAFAGSMARLSRSISEAAQGSAEQTSAFKALGVEVTNADGSLRGTAAVLDDVATKFAGFADGPEKSALAVALFGKSGNDLIPVLNAGASGLAKMREEAKALGIVIDTETARAAEDLNDTITKIGKSSDSLGLLLAEALLPSLQAVADEMLDMSKSANKNREDLRVFAGEAAWYFAATIEGAVGAAKAITAIGGSFYSVAKDIQFFGTIAQKSLFNLSGGLLNGDNRKAIAAALEDRNRVAAEANQRLIDLWNYDGTRISDAIARANAAALLPQASYSNEGRNYARNEPPKPRARRMPGAPGPGGSGGASEAERYLEGLKKQIDGLREMSAEEQVLADIQAKRIKGLTPALEKEILLFAQRLDQARESKTLIQAEQQAREAAARLASASFVALSDEAAALRDGNVSLRDEIAILKGGEEARRAIEKARLDSAIALKEDTLAGLENAGAGKEEIALLREQITLLQDRAKLLSQKNAIDQNMVDPTRRAAEAARDFGRAISESFEDALIGGKSLGDVVRSLGDELLRITTRKLITEPFSDTITDFLKGSGGGGSNVFSTIFSSIFGGGKAAGGPVEPGMLYRVNERRPELLDVNGQQFLMMGSQRGRIDPNPRLGAGPSRVFNANITVNVPQGTSSRTSNQIAGDVAQKLRMAQMRNA